jgi:hypothetical protein
MTIAIKKWLGLAVFGLVACSGKDVNLGNGVGASSSAITYEEGCTPASCANQAAANQACPTSATLQCVPDPNAGQGSDPAGHCNLEAVCPSTDAGSTPITYTGGCTPASCATQAATCFPDPTTSLQCVPNPEPNAGEGSCTMVAVCGSSDAGSTPITYTGGCTPGSCANQAAANEACPTSATLQCVPDPSAGQGSDPAGHCNLEAVCASPDAG